MNSSQLRILKNKYTNLDNNIIKSINLNIKTSTTKSIRTKKSKKKNILKDNNFKIIKNKIENKIILILNKVSKDNINKLTIEFIKNINIENKDDYKLILKQIFLKIVKDIDFIEYYLQFINNIFKIIHYKLKIFPYYFFDIIDEKLKMNYTNNYNLSDDFIFLDQYKNEIFRFNTLKLIFNLSKFNFLSCIYLDKISNVLLEQNTYFEDVYIWFDLVKIKIDEKNIIQDKIECNKITSREKILLINLLDSKKNNLNVVEIIKDEILVEEKNEIDTFKIQINNIIEEFLYLKSEIEVIEFVNLSCKDNNKKNIFCLNLLECYFSKNNNIIEDYIELFNVLISKKIILKNIFSSTLFTFISKNKSINQKKTLELLKLLKKHNITKNLQFLYNKFL